MIERLRSRIFRVRRDEEEGFFLVFFTIMLVLLLALAGLAVDFSNWTYQGQQQQKAADAAALAGAVYLPDDRPTAFATARDVAAKNGYANGSGTTVLVNVGTRPNQLKVTITRTIKNVFAQAIGFKTHTITRTGTSEYQKPIQMGSPYSQFGNDPEARGSQLSQYPGFWGAIAGANSDKSYGDAYAAGVCGRAPSPNGAADDCAGGINTQYDPNGYTYTIHVPAGTGSFTVQAFDPAYVPTGLFCQVGTDQNGNPIDVNKYGGAKDLSATKIPGYPPGDPPSLRYAGTNYDNGTADWSTASKYCTGDVSYHGLDGPDEAVDTTFTTTGPATIPGNPNSASGSICSTTFKGYSGSDIPSDLQQATSYVTNDSGNVPGRRTTLGAMFHAWYPLCRISGSGDYFVRIKTPKGNGENNFALRACAGTAVSSCTPPNGVGIYGNGSMSIYANIGGTGTSSEFPLARVPAGSGGRTLVLRAFDLADADVPGTFTMVGPNGTLSDCTYVSPGSNDVQTGCTITADNAHFNGRWIQINIPIPSGDACDNGTATDCWYKIRFNFDGAVYDTSTWSTYLEGDPVRLIH